MKTSKEKVKEIIDNADKAFNEVYIGSGKPKLELEYIRQLNQNDWLKTHLESAFEIIEYKNAMIKIDKDFHDHLREIKEIKERK